MADFTNAVAVAVAASDSSIACKLLPWMAVSDANVPELIDRARKLEGQRHTPQKPQAVLDNRNRGERHEPPRPGP